MATQILFWVVLIAGLLIRPAFFLPRYIRSWMTTGRTRNDPPKRRAIPSGCSIGFQTDALPNRLRAFIFSSVPLQCAAPSAAPGFTGATRKNFQEFQRDTMVKIRLSRGGAKKRPFYHIIVTDERNARDGRNIERLGYFNPIASGKDVRLEFDTAKAKAWVEKGAQMTEKVKSLYKEAAAQKAA